MYVHRLSPQGIAPAPRSGSDQANALMLCENRSKKARTFALNRFGTKIDVLTCFELAIIGVTR